MVLRLVQFKTNEGSRAVAALDADGKGAHRQWRGHHL